MVEAHANEQQAAYDLHRSDESAEKGIELLRFWNHEVLRETEAVLKKIWEELNQRASSK